MINLELPEKLKQTQQMAQQLASGVFRPISRKYDAIEHCETPEELKPVAQSGLAVRFGRSAGSQQRGWQTRPSSGQVEPPLASLHCQLPSEQHVAPSMQVGLPN